MTQSEQNTAAGPAQSRITLDDLFRRAAARRPGAIALADAPNRERFTDGAALRLSYAEADRMISAIAGRFRRMGLPADAIVGIQLPNTVENILTILGVLRAGLIAAPLPFLWRRADAATALARVGAKAIITCGRAGDFGHAEMATHVAAEVFSIRYVCAFGEDLPDGVVGFDDLFTAAKLDAVPALDRDGDPAAHLAVITFDTGDDGPVPVARRHLECLAGGLSVLLESRLEQDACILSAMAPSSFAGICLTLVPWLLTGGTLALHHAFEADVFARQRRDDRAATLILPAEVAFRVAETGLFAHEGPTTVLAAWRSPERLGAGAPWPERDAALVDIAIFGEAGLLAARREIGARPAAIPLGPVHAPRDSELGVMVAEFSATETNTLGMRGPMVPHQSFPPGIERTDQPHFEIRPGGFVDTGYGCHVDLVSRMLALTGPPADIVTIGGYRFSLCGLLETLGRIDGDATVAALPDPVLGHRLIGNAEDHAAVRAALTAMGLCPLVVAAFAQNSEQILRRAVG